MMPFDNQVTTRLAAKDQFRPCIPKPIDSSAVLPAPVAHQYESQYQSLDTGALNNVHAAMTRATSQYPKGEDVLPAAPSNLYGVQPANVNPHSVASAAPHGIADRL